jgi:hypothetical protein
MSSTINESTRRHRSRAAVRRGVALATVVLLSAGCGSGSSTANGAGAAASDVPATTAGPTVETEVTTPEVTTADATSDGRLAEDALLTPVDLGEPWVDGGFVYPNSAELARTVPTCTAFTELVFAGGARHGEGISGAWINPENGGALLSYVVVFPTVADATAMMEAVKAAAFEECWNDFNVAAMLDLVPDLSEASYATVTPPDLTIDADDYTVEAMDGFDVIGGNKVADSCICVFAQVGRAIVEIHSAADVFEPAERSRMAQVAIDKLRATLAAAS